jgi:hypothetical protein
MTTTTWVLVAVIVVLAFVIVAGILTFIIGLGRAYQRQLTEWEIAERLRPVAAVHRLNGHADLDRDKDRTP